jgi:hypothetical protein
MKIRLVGAELFHADGPTDRHDESNSGFRSFANLLKNPSVSLSPVFRRLQAWCFFCVTFQCSVHVIYPRNSVVPMKGSVYW